MNLEQQTKFAMYLAVKAVCDAYRSIWQTLPTFADGYAEFVKHLNNIQRPSPGKDSSNGNLAQHKLETQQIMCQAAVTIASAIRAYAIKTDNEIVAKAINFSIADFMRVTDAESATRCQNIHDLADTSLAYLTPYGVTAAKLGMLQSAIKAFNAIIEKSRQKKPANQMTINYWNNEFDAADKSLNEGLDDLIEQFQFTNAKFVADYQMARTIGEIPLSQREPDDARSAGQAGAF